MYLFIQISQIYASQSVKFDFASYLFIYQFIYLFIIYLTFHLFHYSFIRLLIVYFIKYFRLNKVFI